jgi:hypothetical protein
VNLLDARRRIAAWRMEYNEKRPHSALGYRTPREFAISTVAWAASPSSSSDSAGLRPPQGQALRAPSAALTRPQPCARDLT